MVVNDSLRVAAATLLVVICTAGCTVCVVLTLRDSPPLSATRVTNVLLPAVVGVPLSVQSPFSVVPADGVPLRRAHVYGGRPSFGTHAGWL